MLVSCGPKKRSHGRGVVGTVRSWSVNESGQIEEFGEVVVCEENESVRCVRLVKGGDIALSCGDDGRLVWSTTEKRARSIASTPESAGGLLCCDTDSRLAMSCGRSQPTKIWEAKKQKIVRTFEGPASACCFGASALCCALAPLQGESMVKVYAIKADKEVCALGDRSTTTPSISRLEFSPTRPHILCALHTDGIVRAWDAARSASYATIIPPLTSNGQSHDTSKATGLSFSPVNQKFFASTATDGTLLFSDLDAAKHVMSLPEQDATAVTFLTERIVAFATHNLGEIKAYDLRKTSAGPLITRKAHDGPVATLHFVQAARKTTPPPAASSATRTHHTETTEMMSAITTTNSNIYSSSSPRVLSPRSPLLSDNGHTSTDASLAHASPALNPNFSSVPSTPSSGRRRHVDDADLDTSHHSEQSSCDATHTGPEQPVDRAENTSPVIKTVESKKEPIFSKADLQASIRDAVRDVTEELRLDIQNLHLDLIRQFQIQQNEISALIADHSARLSDLVSDNDTLRSENRRLQIFIENNNLQL